MVLPAFLTERFIVQTLSHVERFLDEHIPDSEILIVDDGSPDATAEAVRIAGLSRVRLVVLPRNVGKYGALKAGVNISRGRVVVFTDADLPYGVEALPYLVSLLDGGGLHVAVGDRTLPESEYCEPPPFVRQQATRAFSFLVRLLVTDGLFDTQCGLKGFRGDVARALFPLLRDDGFSGDVELLYIALKYNLAIRRIPVRLQHNETSTVRVLRHALSMTGQISRLRTNWKRGCYESAALRRIANQDYWNWTDHAEKRNRE